MGGNRRMNKAVKCNNQFDTKWIERNIYILSPCPSKQELGRLNLNSLASYGKQTFVSHVKVLCLTHPSIHPDIPSLQGLSRSLY